MAEFVIRLADERGRVQEQTHSAATEEELRSRFTQAGYYVYSVKSRNVLGGSSKKKVNLDTFLVFNQQFLTLIKAGLPILGSPSCRKRYPLRMEWNNPGRGVTRPPRPGRHSRCSLPRQRNRKSRNSKDRAARVARTDVAGRDWR